VTVLVSTAEVAVVLGRTASEVEAEAVDLGLLVVRDWADRPALSAADARSLVDGSRRAVAEHEQRWAEHQRQTEAWSAGAQAAAAAASKAVVDRARTRAQASGTPFVPDGRLHAEARAAGMAAAEKWERRTKRPRWLGGRPTVPLSYVEEQDEGVEVS
jgi:hypothetical protein